MTEFLLLLPPQRLLACLHHGPEQRSLTGANGAWITCHLPVVRSFAAGLIWSVLAWWSTRRQPTAGE